MAEIGDDELLIDNSDTNNHFDNTFVPKIAAPNQVKNDADNLSHQIVSADFNERHNTTVVYNIRDETLSIAPSLQSHLTLQQHKDEFKSAYQQAKVSSTNRSIPSRHYAPSTADRNHDHNHDDMVYSIHDLSINGSYAPSAHSIDHLSCIIDTDFIPVDGTPALLKSNRRSSRRGGRRTSFSSTASSHWIDAAAEALSHHDIDTTSIYDQHQHNNNNNDSGSINRFMSPKKPGYISKDRKRTTTTANGDNRDDGDDDDDDEPVDAMNFNSTRQQHRYLNESNINHNNNDNNNDDSNNDNDDEYKEWILLQRSLLAHLEDDTQHVLQYEYNDKNNNKNTSNDSNSNYNNHHQQQQQDSNEILSSSLRHDRIEKHQFAQIAKDRTNLRNMDHADAQAALEQFLKGPQLDNDDYKTLDIHHTTIYTPSVPLLIPPSTTPHRQPQEQQTPHRQSSSRLSVNAAPRTSLTPSSSRLSSLTTPSARQSLAARAPPSAAPTPSRPRVSNMTPMMTPSRQGPAPPPANTPARRGPPPPRDDRPPLSQHQRQQYQRQRQQPPPSNNTRTPQRMSLMDRQDIARGGGTSHGAPLRQPPSDFAHTAPHRPSLIGPQQQHSRQSPHPQQVRPGNPPNRMLTGHQPTPPTPNQQRQPRDVAMSRQSHITAPSPSPSPLPQHNTSQMGQTRRPAIDISPTATSTLQVPSAPTTPRQPRRPTVDARGQYDNTIAPTTPHRRPDPSSHTRAQHPGLMTPTPGPATHKGHFSFDTLDHTAMPHSQGQLSHQNYPQYIPPVSQSVGPRPSQSRFASIAPLPPPTYDDDDDGYGHDYSPDRYQQRHHPPQYPQHPQQPQPQPHNRQQPQQIPQYPTNTLQASSQQNRLYQQQINDIGGSSDPFSLYLDSIDRPDQQQQQQQQQQYHSGLHNDQSHYNNDNHQSTRQYARPSSAHHQAQTHQHHHQQHHHQQQQQQQQPYTSYKQRDNIHNHTTTTISGSSTPQPPFQPSRPSTASRRPSISSSHAQHPPQQDPLSPQQSNIVSVGTGPTLTFEQFQAQQAIQARHRGRSHINPAHGDHVQSAMRRPALSVGSVHQDTAINQQQQQQQNPQSQNSHIVVRGHSRSMSRAFHDSDNDNSDSDPFA